MLLTAVSARLRYFRKYHCYTKRIRVTKARYSLVQPTQLVIEKYFRCAKANLLADGELKTKLTKQFKSQHFGVARKLSRKDLGSTVGRLAAKRLVCRSLQLRRKYAGFLLNSIKCIKSIPLNTKHDFGQGCHIQTTEPYFYEAAYLHVRESPIPVNDDGQCVVAKEVKLEEDTVKKCAVAACTGPKQVPTGCVPHVEKSAECNKWECSKHCKPLNEFEVVSIVTFRAAFELSVEEVRQALAKCDMGCPNGHYTKLVGSLPVDLKGHPIVCYSDHWCTSNLRMLRAASTHFPVLRRFLAHVTDALSAHRAVCDIDHALKNGKHNHLMKITDVQSLLSCDVEEKYNKLKSSELALRRPTLETELAIAHAGENSSGQPAGENSSGQPAGELQRQDRRHNRGRRDGGSAGDGRRDGGNEGRSDNRGRRDGGSAGDGRCDGGNEGRSDNRGRRDGGSAGDGRRDGGRRQVEQQHQYGRRQAQSWLQGFISGGQTVL